MKTEGNHKCSNPALREVQGFDAASLIGTPFPVFLENGVAERYCTECGTVSGHIISKPRELIAAVAILRAFEPQKLTGSEIKFLRKSLGLKSKELAEEISLTSESLSRFENDKQPISEAYEKLLRAAVCLRHIDEARGLEVDVEGLFSMKIQSVRSCREPLSLHLSMECIPESANETPSKWHTRSHNQVA